VQQLSRTVLRNSAFGAVGQITIKVLSFGFSVFIVRTLGAEEYGQYAAILAFGALFVPLADLGLSPYTVREVARCRDRADGREHTDWLYGNVLLLRLVLSIGASVLLVVAAVLTGRPPVMIGGIALGAIGLVMYSALGASDAILAGFERLDLSAVARVLQQLAFVVLGAAALWLGFGYYGLIIANLVAISMMGFLYWRWLRSVGVRPRRVGVGNWPALLRMSLPFAVGAFALGLSYRFDSVLLNIFRSDAETGYYSAVYNLIFSATVLSNVFNSALYPSLTRRAARSPQELPRIYERALRYLLTLGLPLAVGTWALADDVVRHLFTDAYAPAVPALQILIWTLPLMFMSEFLGYVAVVLGWERPAARAMLMSTGFNVGLNVLLVPRFGFLAAAAVTLITEMVLVGQYLWLLRAQVRELDWGRALLRPLAAAAVLGALLLAMDHLPLIVALAVGGIAYAGLVVALRVIGREEVTFIRGLRQPAQPLGAVAAASAPDR
jgi:O-antigen/teichoic acid export membrane protein